MPKLVIFTVAGVIAGILLASGPTATQAILFGLTLHIANGMVDYWDRLRQQRLCNTPQKPISPEHVRAVREILAKHGMVLPSDVDKYLANHPG